MTDSMKTQTIWRLLHQVYRYPLTGSLIHGAGLLTLLTIVGSVGVQAQTVDAIGDHPHPPSEAPASVPSAPGVEDRATPSEVPFSVAPAGSSPNAPGESYIDPTGYSLGATQRLPEHPGYGAEATGQVRPTAIVPQLQVPTSVRVGPVVVGSGGLNVVGLSTLSGSDYYKRLSLRPPTPLAGNVRLIFPLSIPAPITSLFGWRVHPITGDQRFHSGTDLGAPLGTPVLAAVAGRVLLADWLGGYGLTVALEHNQGSQQTLYGHLSEIFVKPGDQVQQGSVIGRVGSTGNSTGPHLHFEFRQLTPEGWVAMDAGAQLEYALAQLIKAFNMAKTQPFTGLDLVPPGNIGKLDAGAEG